MKCLIDSHVVVWWLDDPGKLSTRARQLLADGRNTLYISTASVWELGLKIATGKLQMREDYIDLLKTDGFAFLDITLRHVEAVHQLPLHHRDPFDRLLVPQAIEEDLLFVTRDRWISAYNLPTLEA